MEQLFQNFLEENPSLLITQVKNNQLDSVIEFLSELRQFKSTSKTVILSYPHFSCTFPGTKLCINSFKASFQSENLAKYPFI